MWWAKVSKTFSLLFCLNCFFKDILSETLVMMFSNGLLYNYSFPDDDNLYENIESLSVIPHLLYTFFTPYVVNDFTDIT